MYCTQLSKLFGATVSPRSIHDGRHSNHDNDGNQKFLSYSGVVTTQQQMREISVVKLVCKSTCVHSDAEL